MAPAIAPTSRARWLALRSAAAALALALTVVGLATLTGHRDRATAAAVTITQFPVQGPCSYFANSFGQPRSGGRLHEGLDILPRSGKAGGYIYAVADGTLTGQFLAADEPLAGNGWKLQRSDGTFFSYFHMSTFAPGLSVGAHVVTGQILGQVGQTGNAAGPHLHFEVHPGGGAAVDPYPVVEPIDGCCSSAIPRQPAGGIEVGLQPAVRLDCKTS
jgi:murein DD-endopeptidase MepM/ murein hydrolase activator NlpD